MNSYHAGILILFLYIIIWTAIPKQKYKRRKKENKNGN